MGDSRTVPATNSLRKAAIKSSHPLQQHLQVSAMSTKKGEKQKVFCFKQCMKEVVFYSEKKEEAKTDVMSDV